MIYFLSYFVNKITIQITKMHFLIPRIPYNQLEAFKFNNTYIITFYASFYFKDIIINNCTLLSQPDPNPSNQTQLNLTLALDIHEKT